MIEQIGAIFELTYATTGHTTGYTYNIVLPVR
jgi:hypothetical protein